MSKVRLPSEKGTFLDLSEGEDNYALWRPSELVTIAASGILTVEGSGRYKVLPNTGVSDDVTGIVVVAENIEGCRIQLRPATAGHTIRLLHQAGLHLLNGSNQSLTTDMSTIWLWLYSGSTVWAQDGPISYIP